MLRLTPIAFAALLFTSCNDSSRPSSGAHPLTVGFSQIGAESAWRAAETVSIKAEASRRGVDLKFSDAQQDQGKQIQALRDFIALGVDAVILAPKVEEGFEPVLAELKKAGIPVVLVDRGVHVSDPSLYATLIASDFVDEGRRAAEWLAKHVDGKANVLELQGTAGSAPANDRAKGFRDGIAQHPGITIVRSQSGDFALAKGKEVTEAALKSMPGGFDVVFAHNDDMALGAIQALEAAGKQPGKDVIVVSIDAVAAAFEAMVAGKLDCTVECNPLMGPAAFDAVEKAVKGETLPKWIKVEDQVFDRGNAAAAKPNRRY